MFQSPTHIIEVSTPAELVNVWKNVLGRAQDSNGRYEDVDIEVVEIIGHGSYSSSDLIGNILFDGAMFYAKSVGYMGINDKSIDDIKSQKMYFLKFVVCNSANPDFNKNISDAFYEKNPDIQNVIGRDGGVIYYAPWNSKKFWLWYTDQPSTTQTTFDALIAEEDSRKPGEVIRTR